MIFYFSGTGNSFYIAKQLLQEKERLINISDAMNKHEFEYNISDAETVGFVFPVYFHSIPTIVKNFISNLHLNNVDYSYCIFTCHKDIGHADSLLYNYLSARNIKLKYTNHIIMPNNCIFYSQIPNEMKSREIIANSESQLKTIQQNINKCCESNINTSTHNSIISNILYDMHSKTAKFFADENCSGCGLCEKNCPENVITLIDGKPLWQKNKCSKCSKCINTCPNKSIQYGNKTKNRNRYINIDTISLIDIYFDKDKNIILFPYIHNKYLIPTMSNHFFSLEKGYTLKDLEETIASTIKISEDNMPETKESISPWTSASGIKSFRSFSKKYNCIGIRYIPEKNNHYIDLLYRCSDGSYEHQQNNSSEYIFTGRQNPKTIALYVMEIINNN